ncbi:unnamed protein product [Didymodactylos carnosus]|uniref:Uncharacterized protein n=1 Tax=Didymodactylos carnosus TaxID=1234261 RepID=A0A814MMW5_9BILA|nr:unnamed protein product [Didymodactylos carnosus]CAF1080530.1 unnamed protein product [Didymodactylos carnosus]CAF3674893.1 unnamed protein product [Didymodactylos carnosus]CAF3846510.1 unnamed protein product [Didymodactylos carnosus]
MSYDSDTEKWNVLPEQITYGCNWNRCNDPKLVPKLPESFLIQLPTDWLSINLLPNGTAGNPSTCHNCPDAPQCGDTDFFDISRCPEIACNGSCVMEDKFDDPESIPLQFCYQSICDTSPVTDNRQLVIGSIYYLEPRELNILEMQVSCRADDCSRPEIFQDIRQKMTEKLDLDAFLNQRPVGGAVQMTYNYLLILSMSAYFMVKFY